MVNGRILIECEVLIRRGGGALMGMGGGEVPHGGGS